MTWRLSSATNRLASSRAIRAVRAPATNVQGALTLHGRYYTSSSHGSRNGTLASGVPGGRVSTRPWIVGAEDLTCSSHSGRLYGLSEHPGMRSVFGVRL